MPQEESEITENFTHHKYMYILFHSNKRPRGHNTHLSHDISLISTSARLLFFIATPTAPGP
jgi:hypothetical protein